MVIAVDFDGTLCSANYPEIGNANHGLIEKLKELQHDGNQLILWTCRAGERLNEAVYWCKMQGLVFDAINDNVPEMIEIWGNDSRKITADIYIDDRSEKPWSLLLGEAV